MVEKAVSTMPTTREITRPASAKERKTQRQREKGFRERKKNTMANDEESRQQNANNQTNTQPDSNHGEKKTVEKGQEDRERERQ